MAVDRNAVVDQAIAAAVAELPSVFDGVEIEVVRAALLNAIINATPKEVALSTTSPDYESVVWQLVADLSSHPVWYDTITTAVGQRLIGWIASGIAYGQFAIERSLQEGFVHLASAESSVYAGAAHLGVRVERMIPAEVRVQLTRLDKTFMLEIPRHTKFSIQQVPFFNRTAIIFPADSFVTDVVLTQGEVNSINLKGTGQPNQEYEVGDGTKDLSDSDLFVEVGGVEWKRSLRAPWLLDEEEPSFTDSTSPIGNPQVIFGNGLFGLIPRVDQPIKITWVRTSGEDGNYAQSNSVVSYNGPSIDDQISGVTQGPVIGGRDMQSADYYARMAPYMRAAPENAVRRQDYRRWAVAYSGIKDAMFRGQAELGPYKRSAMNIIGVTLLTETPWTEAQYITFFDYMQKERGIFQCEFVRLDPSVIGVNIVADIYCTPRSSLAAIQSQLTAAIRDMFKPRLGWLGYEVYRSDIIDVLEGVGVAGGEVQYVKLAEPTKDVTLANTASYIQLGSVTLNMHYTKRNSDFSGRLDLGRS